METSSVDKRRFWQHPWGYHESFIISLSILILGFILEAIIRKPVYPPFWPYNFIIIVVFVAYIIFSSLFVKHPFIKWLSSIPATISAISIFTALILLMGFIPQVEKAKGFIGLIGLNRVNHSWPYLLMAFYLLTILGFTTVRRAKPFNLKNFAFLLNHGGLWLVIVSASFGSGDLWRLSVPAYEEQLAVTAYDRKNNSYHLDFGIKLIDFKIEEYTPSLAVYNKITGEAFIKKGDKLLNPDEKKGKLADWQVEILKYIPHAKSQGDGFVKDTSMHAFPVVFVKAFKGENKGAVTGWVTVGNIFTTPRYLDLDSKYALAMTIPRPKKFSSDVVLYESMTESKNVKIEVNKPVKFKGWKIYQVGYDEEMGKYSNLSVFEIVRDPWLPVIYTGIFMLLAGSLYLFWTGSSRKQ